MERSGGRRARGEAVEAPLGNGRDGRKVVGHYVEQVRVRALGYGVTCSSGRWVMGEGVVGHWVKRSRVHWARGKRPRCFWVLGETVKGSLGTVKRSLGVGRNGRGVIE